jgi:hypothetical protein
MPSRSISMPVVPAFLSSACKRTQRLENLVRIMARVMIAIYSLLSLNVQPHRYHPIQRCMGCT